MRGGVAGPDSDHQEWPEGRDEQRYQSPQGEYAERQAPVAQISDRQKVHGENETDKQEMQVARIHELIVQGWRVKGKKINFSPQRRKGLHQKDTKCMKVYQKSSL
jgi:hypothetical protein